MSTWSSNKSLRSMIYPRSRFKFRPRIFLGGRRDIMRNLSDFFRFPPVIPAHPLNLGEDRLENPGNDISDTVSSHDTATPPLTV